MLNWQAIAADLRRLHFAGWVILELAPPNEPVPACFARALRQTIDRLESAPPAA